MNSKGYGGGSKTSYGKGITKTSETTVESRLGEDDEIQLVEFEQGKKAGSDGQSERSGNYTHTTQRGFAH
jgi:hypothetical protein